MKLVPKLTVALVAGMCIVLAINSYLRVRRETESFERERVARHRRAAIAVSAAMTATWRTDGEPGAVAMMDAVSAGFPSLETRWLPGAALPNAAPDAPITTIRAGEEGERRFTFVPVVFDGATRGLIELSEDMNADVEHTRAIVAETIKTAFALTVLSAVVAFLLGHVFVGKPVRALAEHARRTGGGDFQARAEVTTDDELADLAREMNRMSERLVRTIEQLRHADRLATVGKLASGIAHELGTPLNVVAARAEMIASGRTSLEQNREYAAVIIGASERMTRIIRQVLQFARRKTVRRQRSEVTSLVRETVDLLRPLATKCDVEVEVEAEASPVEAPIDQAEMQQVLTNLIMNAVQASARGKVVRVRVGSAREVPPADVGGDARDVARIVVEDEGVGISAEDVPRIFEPFFTTKDIGEGTGLGLAVSYGIVREHGGWISVASERGRGSTFTVLVPQGGDE